MKLAIYILGVALCSVACEQRTPSELSAIADDVEIEQESGADQPSAEQTAEKRLHEILGTKSIQKDTRYHGSLIMIDVPDGSRHSNLLRSKGFNWFYFMASVWLQENRNEDTCDRGVSR